MRRILFFLLLVCAVFLEKVESAPSSSSRASLYSEDDPRSWEIFLKECLDEFLTEIVKGNIEEFDPWIASHSSFSMEVIDNSINLKADANATNVRSVGFSSFIPSSVEFDEETEDYKISMILNDFKLDGMYFLTGSHHLFYPIVGAGPFDITLYGVSSTGTVVLKNNGTQNCLEEIRLSPLSYTSAAAMYDNLQISGTTTNPGVKEKVTQDLTSELWKQVQDDLIDQLSESIVAYLTEKLSCSKQLRLEGPVAKKDHVSSLRL